MNKTRPFSLGFIGGSLASAVGYAHFAACTMDRRWSVDAGCFSPDADDNVATANAYGVAPDRLHSGWREFLAAEKGRLDAVAVLTPTPMHYEIVTECLDQRIPVICEKALALNSSHARELAELCSKTKGFLAVSYNYSGYPMVRELRSLIRRGVLGEVLHFQAEMPQEGFLRVDAHGNKPSPQSWRLVDGVIPTIYLDLAVHLHHLLFYLTDQQPLEVIADQRRYGWFDVVDNVTCLCRYTNDVQGQIWFSKSALGHRNGLRLRIYGSTASAEWFQAAPEEGLLSFQDGRRQVLDRAATVELAGLRRYNRFKAGHPAGYIEAFANLYDDIAAALDEYRSSGSWKSEEVFSGDMAAEGLKMLEAMAESATTGGWVSVNNKGR
jgi:predicted dehydrogenase